MKNYSDLTNPDTFKGGPVVGVVAAPAGVVLSTIPDSDFAEIPERLFERFLCLCRGYELHAAFLLDSNDDSELNSVQCEGLIGDLEFLQATCNDEALSATLNQLAEQAAKVIRRPDLTLVFSPN